MELILVLSVRITDFRVKWTLYIQEDTHATM